MISDRALSLFFIRACDAFAPAANADTVSLRLCQAVKHCVVHLSSVLRIVAHERARKPFPPTRHLRDPIEACWPATKREHRQNSPDPPPRHPAPRVTAAVCRSSHAPARPYVQCACRSSSCLRRRRHHTSGGGPGWCAGGAPSAPGAYWRLSLPPPPDRSRC
jgi:hypothetical protein